MLILSLMILTMPTLNSVSSLSPTHSSTTSNNSSLQKDSDTSKTPFELSDELKSLINVAVDTNKTNAGVIVGLVDPNGYQFYGYGKMSNANNTIVDQDSVFAIGSNTKVFTAILLADMVEDGLIKLDDPIQKYLPQNITVPQYNGHEITVGDLATHTSGLPEFPPNYCPTDFASAHAAQTPTDMIQTHVDLMNCPEDYGLDQLYQGLSNTTISREPGSKVEYSTFGSALLGDILVSISNSSSYDELLKERILNVLGMDSTSVNLSDAQKSQLAIGHLYSQELPIWNLSSPLVAAGGLHSSASDMLKFLSANIGLIKTKLDKAMQESHLIRLDTGRVLPNNLNATAQDNTTSGFYSGLGWFITTDFGNEIIWHNGATLDGYNAFMAFNPASDRGIVILFSSDPENADLSLAGAFKSNYLSYLVWNLLKG